MKRGPNGDLVSVMNFAKCSEFGDPVVCLPRGQMALSPHPTKEKLREVFRDFTDNDFIVAVGDPTLIFLAGMVICDLNRGRCNMLKYDREVRSYLKVEFNIHQRLGG